MIAIRNVLASLKTILLYPRVLLGTRTSWGSMRSVGDHTRAATSILALTISHNNHGT